MRVKQIADFINTAAQQADGSITLVKEDLSNIVDVGDEIGNLELYDKFTKALVDHIGRVVVEEREYKGVTPSLYMDSWDYGAIREKIEIDLYEASDDEAYELEDGEVYEQDMFRRPNVTAHFWNQIDAFEIDASFPDFQLKSAFSSATQMNAFLSALYNRIEQSITVRVDEAAKRAINNMIAETVYDDYAGGTLSTASHVKAVNLLYLYNQSTGTTITADAAIKDPAFLRFASYTIRLCMKRLARMSRLFNVGGTAKFTPAEYMNVIMLADFEAGARTYLYDAEGQFKDEELRLPDADVVPYWQGSGTGYAFSDTSKVYVKTAKTGQDVTVTGVLCVLADRLSVGITNKDRHTTTHHNAKAEFQNAWYKCKADYFNDMNENFIVFFAA